MPKIHFLYPPHLTSLALPFELRYGQTDPQACDVFVVFGGDGFFLQAVQSHWQWGSPFYGLNHGTAGFLLNAALGEDADLIQRLASVEPWTFPLLTVQGRTIQGQDIEAVAVNDIALLRQEGRIMQYRVWVAGEVLWSHVRGDGIVVSTPLGSTAYTASAGGPILEIGLPALVATPLNTYVPNGLQSLVCSGHQTLTLEALSCQSRPAYLSVDALRFSDIQWVTLQMTGEKTVTFWMDPGQTWLHRQFSARHVEFNK